MHARASFKAITRTQVGWQMASLMAWMSCGARGGLGGGSGGGGSEGGGVGGTGGSPGGGGDVGGAGGGFGGGGGGLGPCIGGGAAVAGGREGDGGGGGGSFVGLFAQSVRTSRMPMHAPVGGRKSGVCTHALNSSITCGGPSYVHVTTWKLTPQVEGAATRA